MKLKNTTKVVQVINIPCLAPECAEGKCFCVDVSTPLVEELPEGIRGSRLLERRLPGNITIRAGDTSEDLPSWVADTPTVKAALSAKRVRLVE